jgi:hypothetical protein
MLFEPGVAMRIGLFVGTPGMTFAASARVLLDDGVWNDAGPLFHRLADGSEENDLLFGAAVFLVDLHYIQQAVNGEKLRGWKAVIRGSDSETGKL